jgi:hypothetical protein
MILIVTTINNYKHVQMVKIYFLKYILFLFLFL